MAIAYEKSQEPDSSRVTTEPEAMGSWNGIAMVTHGRRDGSSPEVSFEEVWNSFSPGSARLMEPFGASRSEVREVK